MSQLSLKTIRLGDSADPTKNFIISVPAIPDGTLSIAREDGTVVLKIETTGTITMPFGVTP